MKALVSVLFIIAAIIAVPTTIARMPDEGSYDEPYEHPQLNATEKDKAAEFSRKLAVAINGRYNVEQITFCGDLDEAMRCTLKPCGTWQKERTWETIVNRFLKEKRQSGDPLDVLIEALRRYAKGPPDDSRLGAQMYARTTGNWTGFCSATRKPTLQLLQTVQAELSKIDPALSDHVFAQLLPYLRR